MHNILIAVLGLRPATGSVKQLWASYMAVRGRKAALAPSMCKWASEMWGRAEVLV